MQTIEGIVVNSFNALYNLHASLSKKKKIKITWTTKINNNSIKMSKDFFEKHLRFLEKYLKFL